MVHFFPAVLNFVLIILLICFIMISIFSTFKKKHVLKRLKKADPHFFTSAVLLEKCGYVAQFHVLLQFVPHEVGAVTWNVLPPSLSLVSRNVKISIAQRCTRPGRYIRQTCRVDSTELGR